MKNSKKILFILICLSIIFTIISIIQTYAKYVTSVSGTTSTSIAKWNISVNDVSIKSGLDLSSAILPVFPGNTDIAPDVLAPNAEGYFDLEIDFSEVEVSFNFTITISANEHSAVTDLIITGYSIDDDITNEIIVPFTDSTNTITNAISYTDDILDSTTSRTIRIFIKWDDTSTTETMDNIADTASTMGSDNSGLLDVHISFTQTNT